MKIHTITFILLIVGGLNWLLAAFGWEIGDRLLGGMDTPVSRIIYILVGLSAVYEAVTHKGRCKACDSGMSGMKQGM